MLDGPAAPVEVTNDLDLLLAQLVSQSGACSRAPSWMSTVWVRGMIEVRVAPDGATRLAMRVVASSSSARTDAWHRRRPRRSGVRRPGRGRRRPPPRDRPIPARAPPPEHRCDLEGVRKAAHARAVTKSSLLAHRSRQAGREPLAIARHRLIGGLSAKRDERSELFRRGFLPAISANAACRSCSYSRNVATPRAAAAAGLFSSCASPAASLPTASNFSRSRSTPLDRAAHGLERGQELAKQRRMCEREPAELTRRPARIRASARLRGWSRGRGCR